MGDTLLSDWKMAEGFVLYALLPVDIQWLYSC